jgi:uncharacterized protein (TIGR02996 family)
MSQKEAFLRAIREAPEDNTHRLVYADWLTDQGETTHAQLIRVQCELASKKCKGARRQTLRAEEAKLLEDESLHLSEERRFRYQRGFIADECELLLDGRGCSLDIRRPMVDTDDFDEWDADNVAIQLTAKNVAALDWCLALTLNLTSLGGPKESRNALFGTCLQRVTELACIDAEVEPDALVQLAASPDLVSLDTLTFHQAGPVPLRGVLALFTAPASPGIRHVHLDGEDWLDENDDPINGDDAEGVVAFLRRVGQDPRSARLVYFALNYCHVGNAVAQALLDSPHLQPAEQLALFVSRSMSTAQKRALKKRFGSAMQLL